MTGLLIKNINSKNLVNEILKRNKNVYYLNAKKNIYNLLQKYFKNENTIIFMGAGSITAMAYKLIKE